MEQGLFRRALFCWTETAPRDSHGGMARSRRESLPVPLLFLLFSLFPLASLALERPAHAADWDKPGWQLTFHDEFDGSAIDGASWVKRYKWGQEPINGELQAYVDDAFQLQNGVL